VRVDVLDVRVVEVARVDVLDAIADEVVELMKLREWMYLM
jgi:hypothetical protein